LFVGQFKIRKRIRNVRRLYIIQMVHSLHDQSRYPSAIRDEIIDGSEKVLRAGLMVNGKLLSGNQQSPWTVVDNFWILVEEELMRNNFLSAMTNGSRLYVYCESLAYGSDEIDINMQIKIGARDNNPAFLVLNRLLGLGAKVRETESQQLLDVTQGHICHCVLAQKLVLATLNKCNVQRDRAIASRIHRDLPEGSIGLLFIGCSHNVTRSLAWRRPRIRVNNLIEVGPIIPSIKRS